MARSDFARSRQDENMQVEQQRVATAGPVSAKRMHAQVECGNRVCGHMLE
jgi:hypothetical protein